MNTNQRTSVVGLVSERVSDPSKRAEVFGEVHRLEQAGYSFEKATASLELLIRRVLSADPLPFSVLSYHVSMRSGERTHICEASVMVNVGGKRFHEVSEGSGPLNALDKAIRIALSRAKFKGVQQVSLNDYNVSMLNGAPGTAAKTSVLIQSGNGKKSWWTVGVSQNVVEASLQALTDSIEYALVFG